MTSLAEKTEMDVLRVLRDRYEREGYTFLTHPPADLVPEFLGRHRPDAIAVSDHGSFVIEVVGTPGPSSARRLEELARRVANEPSWKLKVYRLPPRREVNYPEPTERVFDSWIEDANTLREAGRNAASFVMAWIALEALVKALAGTTETDGVWPPSQVVEWLASMGYAADQSPRVWRHLARIRGTLVHGGITLSVEPSDLELLLDVVTTLRAELARRRGGKGQESKVT